jgi:hypothetical protein
MIAASVIVLWALMYIQLAKSWRTGTDALQACTLGSMNSPRVCSTRMMWRAFWKATVADCGSSTNPRV